MAEVNHRDLFGSTTGNGKYGLFHDPRVMAFFNDVNVVLTEMAANQSIVYWAVEKDLSDVDSLYGESENKVTRNPVQIFCRVLLDTIETITGQFGTEKRRKIEAYIQKDRLTELGIVPRDGDFIQFDSQMFEIVSTEVPQFVFGMPQTKIGITIKANSTREDVFDPYKDEVNKEIEHDSENPY